MIYEAIKRLTDYGLEKGLLGEDDRIYATNQILDALHMDEYEDPGQLEGTKELEEILK